jgi:hypothetical protein
MPFDTTNSWVAYDGAGLIGERYGMTPSPGDDLGPYGCGWTPDANGNFYAWNSGCTINESQQVAIGVPVQDLPPPPPPPAPRPKPKPADPFVELARDISRRTAPVPWLVQGFMEISTAFVSPWLQAGLCAVAGCTPVGATMAALPFAPGNLAEKLLFEEAAANGTRIMAGRIADPRYPEEIFSKMEWTHRGLDGTKTTVHYWLNRITGEAFGFKIK